ncbi:MAG: hypothetical protein ACK5GD_02520, partial [Planctomycetota bacterium]
NNGILIYVCQRDSIFNPAVGKSDSAGHCPRGAAPGYGVHGRWPIEPVAMFDGPMRYPVFSPTAIFIVAWGNAPGIGLCCVWPLANRTGRDVR